MITRFLMTLALVLAPTLGQAACYADYKAKQDDPLRLHYGVIRISGGDCPGAGEIRSTVASKIGRDGWTLLNIVSTFGDEGLQKRKASAGDYYLRY